MDPKNLENLSILKSNLSNQEKLDRMSASPERYLGRFDNLIERLVPFLRPVDEGIGNTPDDAARQTYSNFETDPLKITEYKGAPVTLSFFIYSPSSGVYRPSILARWKTVDAEAIQYLSAKNFDANVTTTHKEDAPHILDLLEESVAAYEEAASLDL